MVQLSVPLFWQGISPIRHRFLGQKRPSQMGVTLWTAKSFFGTYIGASRKHQGDWLGPQVVSMHLFQTLSISSQTIPPWLLFCAPSRLQHSFPSSESQMPSVSETTRSLPLSSCMCAQMQRPSLLPWNFAPLAFYPLHPLFTTFFQRAHRVRETC